MSKNLARERRHVEFLIFALVAAPYLLIALLRDQSQYLSGSIAYGALMTALALTNLGRKSPITLPLTIYIMAAIAIGSITGLFAIDIRYSVLRSTFSSINAFIVIIVFFNLFLKSLTIGCDGRFLSLLTAVTLSSLIAAEYLLPGWSANANWRLSGGTNPNQFAMLALSLFFIVAIMSLPNNGISGMGIAALMLCLLTLVLAMSRSAIAGLMLAGIITLTCYFYPFLLLGRRIIIREFFILSLVIVASIATVIYIFILYYNDGSLSDRVFNIENLTSRARAWLVMLDSFRSNPLFGGIGWWESSTFIELQTSDHENVAVSPHNAYIAILAEGGLIAFLFIFGAIACLLWTVLRLAFSLHNTNRRAALLPILAFGSILGLLAREFFENAFLRGVFEFGNTAILATISFALAIMCYYKNFGRACQ